MSCASWMGRTLLLRVASGTKLLGVSSNYDLLSSWIHRKLFFSNWIFCHFFDSHDCMKM